MHTPVPSPYLVPFDGRFRVAQAPTTPPDEDSDGDSKPDDGKRSDKRSKDYEDNLDKELKKLRKLQRVLYAKDHHAILCVFQAMDAAGKDSTIRAVFASVDPAGYQVASFKQPSSEERDHDFLWRTTKALPERGRIGVFNRSHYEEVLVARVHPNILQSQNLPDLPAEPDAATLKKLWAGRFDSIRDHEAHLARSGMVIVKFWLNVSPDEQARRFLDRLDEPDKNWKFAAGDLRERERWDDYMEAYEDALNETSRPQAPWYAIPADDKPYMRWQVARILRKTLEGLGVEYPEPTAEEREEYPKFQAQLRAELGL